MKRLPVESSSIAAIGYDPHSRTLEIEFRNGGVYQYFGVAPLEFEGLRSSSSKGRYFNRRILNRFEFKQV